MRGATLRSATGGAAEHGAAAAEFGGVPRAYAGIDAANNKTRARRGRARERHEAHAETCTNSKKGRPCRKVKQFTASRA